MNSGRAAPLPLPSALAYVGIEDVYRAFPGYARDTGLALERNQQRYTEWWLAGSRLGLFDSEFLLPQLRKNIVPDDFPFTRKSAAWDPRGRDDLEAKVRRLGPWPYHLRLADHVTTDPDGVLTAETIAFHRYRSKLISETIEQLLGDELGSCEILDLACHCGLFALDLAHRGAQRVHGVDLRAANIAQANFLKDHFGIANATFAVEDVGALAPGIHDVVMCLGLLYHITDPIALIQYCHDNARKFAVIDTICHKEPISCYHVVCGKDVSLSIEGDKPIEFHPTYRAVIDTMRQAGFKTIVEVVGLCAQPIELYADQTRRCFVGFKDRVEFGRS